MPGKVSRRVVWGIDVASSAIKGVKMCVGRDGPRILDADIVPLMGQASASDAPGRDRRVWQALQTFREKHRIGSELVVAGLPGIHFFTRPFNVFVVGLRTENELVRYELEQHVPFGLDAVLWDHEVFTPTGPSDRELNGLLFAMKKEILNDYLLSLSAVNLEPRKVQAAPVALYNYAKHEMDCHEPVLVVDIGGEETTVLAVTPEQYFLRTIKQGGNLVTESVQRTFQPRTVLYDDAEAIKQNLPQLRRRAEILDRLQPGLRAFMGELRNTLTQLRRDNGFKPSRMALLGGGSRLPGLARMLSEELRISVATPAGLRNISVDEAADPAYVNGHLPSLAAAIGLALQGVGLGASRVNVIGATLMRRRSQTLLKRVAAAAIVAVGLVSVALGGFSSWRTSVLNQGAQELTTYTRPLHTRYRQWQLLTQPGQAEKRMDTLAGMATQRKAWLAVLDKVARILPENDRRSVSHQDKVWLARMTLTAGDGDEKKMTGVLEAGTPLRSDETHLKYAEKILKAPLENDERGLFGNVEVEQSQRTAELRFSSKTDKPRFLMMRLTFDVNAESLKGQP